jgi:hypothetical protein
MTRIAKNPQGPRPHVWKSGPDPVRHYQYLCWLRARAQANYRGEPWQLSYEEWVELWGDNWHRRGRGGESLQASRVDVHKPWSRSNIRLLTRAEINRLKLGKF